MTQQPTPPPKPKPITPKPYSRPHLAKITTGRELLEVLGPAQANYGSA